MASAAEDKQNNSLFINYTTRIYNKEEQGGGITALFPFSDMQITHYLLINYKYFTLMHCYIYNNVYLCR